MYRFVILIFLVSYVFSCTPKLATTTTSESYDEDLSSFRPRIETSEAKPDEDAGDVNETKPYVPPTHDINSEMSVLMDSIIHYNREKSYLTYTIQVYIGRSREEANQIREKVYRILPNEKPALSWKQPSWLVTVGEYHERVDAYKTFSTLREAFPGATMVPEWKNVE